MAAAKSAVALEELSPIEEIELLKIHGSKDNPRKRFDKRTLQELATSIDDRGFKGSILLRIHEGPCDMLPDDHYEIVWGERRFRAMVLLKRKTIPAQVQTIGDLEAMYLRITENIQRDDLTAMEQARGFRALTTVSDESQKDLAHSLGVSPQHFSNTLGLLDVPGSVQKKVEDGTITRGHVKAIAVFTKAPIWPKIEADLELRGAWPAVSKMRDWVEDWLGRNAPRLSNMGYRDGAIFDVKSLCDGCEFKVEVPAPYGGAKGFVCLDPAAFRDKTRTAKKDIKAAQTIAKKKLLANQVAGKSIRVTTVAGMEAKGINPQQLGNYNQRFQTKTCHGCPHLVELKKEYGGSSPHCLKVQCFNARNKRVTKDADDAMEIENEVFRGFVDEILDDFDGWVMTPERLRSIVGVLAGVADAESVIRWGKRWDITLKGYNRHGWDSSALRKGIQTIPDSELEDALLRLCLAVAWQQDTEGWRGDGKRRTGFRGALAGFVSQETLKKTMDAAADDLPEVMAVHFHGLEVQVHHWNRLGPAQRKRISAGTDPELVINTETFPSTGGLASKKKGAAKKKVAGKKKGATA